MTFAERSVVSRRNTAMLNSGSIVPRPKRLRGVGCPSSSRPEPGARLGARNYPTASANKRHLRYYTCA